MGATKWIYFVPYQPDINMALQQLKQQAFESGKYFKHDHSQIRAMSENEARQAARDTITLTGEPDFFQSMIDEWLYIKGLPEPDTIEKLLDWNLAEGTHTIMDMSGGVSEKPQIGTVSPLSIDQLLIFFNTTQPRHEQIASENFDFDQVREEGQGLYIIVYENGQPVEICFMGVSGD